MLGFELRGNDLRLIVQCSVGRGGHIRDGGGPKSDNTAEAAPDRLSCESKHVPGLDARLTQVFLDH